MTNSLAKHHQPAETSLVDECEHYDGGEGQVRETRNRVALLYPPAPSSENNEGHGERRSEPLMHCDHRRRKRAGGFALPPPTRRSRQRSDDCRVENHPCCSVVQRRALKQPPKNVAQQRQRQERRGK